LGTPYILRFRLANGCTYCLIFCGNFLLKFLFSKWAHG